MARAVARAARKALEWEGSVGVITGDSRAGRIADGLRGAGLDVQLLGRDDAYARLVVVPATLAKGLEYDSVLVVEPAEIVAGEASEQVGLRRLYVCLTRAVTALAVVHAQPLPAALAGPATSGA